jgi:phospholipid N-methyltransferase
MAAFSFIWQYLTRPRTVGAVLPSSKYLAQKMMQPIDFTRARCIVEYGPGTGVFTERLINMRQAGTVILVIERNETFCDILREKFAGETDVHIISDSAEQIREHLHTYGFDYADYIVSGLPFASLPSHVTANILTQTKKYLRPNGRFITFQYTLIRKELIAGYFNDITLNREFRNVPPAYVLACGNG